jgi:hypothetical protein
MIWRVPKNKPCEGFIPHRGCAVDQTFARLAPENYL